MSINDQPSFESYDLRPPQPSFLKRSLFKKIISLSLVLFLAVLSVVFFSRRLRSGSSLPSAPPSALQASGDLRPPGSPQPATTSAEARFNPFGSLLYSDSIESSVASSQTPFPPFSFLSQDLTGILESLLTEPDLEIREDSTGTVRSCRMKGTYLGRLKGAGQYGRSKNTYADTASQAECRAISLPETYNETYYFEDLFYNRQSESQPFKKIPASSAELKAQKPADYLEFYFSNPNDFKVVSVIPSDSAVKVLTIFSKIPLTGSLTFSIDSDHKVTAFSYSLTSGPGDLKAELSGEVSLLRPSPSFAPPTN